jgi:hypothetical protein
MCANYDLCDSSYLLNELKTCLINNFFNFLVYLEVYYRFYLDFFDDFNLTPEILSDPIWVAGLLGQPLTYPKFTILFLALTSCVTPHMHKLQGKLSFIQNRVVSKKV